MKKIYLLRCTWMFACTTLLFSCKKDLSSLTQENVSLLGGIETGKAGIGRIYYGNAVRMGNGEARTFFSVSSTGEPQELGIEMSKGALSNLPHDHDKGVFHLKLPAEVKEHTAFDHIVIHWNEHGHPPFFYQLPHFDFHFYTISEKERLAIPSYQVNPTGFDNNPSAGKLPPTYIAPPGGEEAQMGKHWVDATASELPWNGGATFTKTFIYGSYDGKVNFIEPMITLAYLQATESSSTSFPQSAVFEKHAFYPQVYNVYKTHNGNTYNVSLSNFVLR